METFQRKVNPISSTQVYNHYNQFVYSDVTLKQYCDTWRTWLTDSHSKSLLGLDQFNWGDFCNGTTNAFDHFILRNAQKEIVVFPGEFQYHGCASKHIRFRKLDPNWLDIERGQALIISAPFSDLARHHPRFDEIMAKCTDLGVPVCLDLAYWGIAKNIHIDLDKYPCISEVVSSLSKPFNEARAHRIGVRFTRIYVDDGISMMNEVDQQNTYAMSLGVHFMKEFSADWCWNQFETRYLNVIEQYDLTPTDTVLFALGDAQRHPTFNRGIPGNHRICISNKLSDLT